MKIHDCTQNSEEWLRIRSGIPTASEFDNLISPTGKIRTGEMPHSYLCKKLAEKWLGQPLPGFMSMAMDFGHVLEEEAIPMFTLTTNLEVQRVGFITTDDGLVGCSPDGLIGDNFGIEIKCPEPIAHVRYLLAGELPNDYLLQVQGSMFVTGLKSWYFMSYRRNFPPLIILVERDEKLQEVIAEALEEFCEKLKAGYERLKEINER